MAWVAVAGAAITVGGSYLSSRNQKKSAGEAADAQIGAAQLGVDETRRQFDAIQKLLMPYANAGTGALAGQQDLLGMNGGNAQGAAVSSIQSSPMFASLAAQGEDSILQNASATGGLRGGNVQGALAQFRPALLNGLIDQQYARLGGLTSMGQNAAAGVGNAGMQTGQAVTQLLGQQGAAQAGAALANGQANGQLINSVTGAFGQFAGSGALGRLFGSGGGGATGAVQNTLF